MVRAIVGAKETNDGVTFRIREDETIKYQEVKMRNYLYIETNDYNIFKSEFDLISWIIDVETKDNKYTKLILKNNFMKAKVKELCDKNRIKTYESDINTAKRWLVNYPNVPINATYVKSAFWDLETYDLGDFEFDKMGVVIAQYPIISCSVVDQDENQFYFVNEGVKNVNPNDFKILQQKYQLELENETIKLTDKKQYKEGLEKIKQFNIDNNVSEINSRVLKQLVNSEPKLINEILNKLTEYDVINAYNGDRFDVPYLKQRMANHNIENENFKLINAMDYLEIYKKNVWESKVSYSLDNVSQDELGEAKIKVEKGPSKILELYLFNPEKLKEYNMKDSLLMKWLDDKLNFLQIQFAQADLAHCLIIDTMYNANMCDISLLSEYNKIGYVCEDKPTGMTRKIYENQHIGGGWTNCFIPGLHSNVEIFDKKSFYPCTIITYNISPETYIKGGSIDGCITTPEDMHKTNTREDYHPHRYYRQDVQGVLPKLLQNIIIARDKTKYTMDEFKESDPLKYHAMWLEQFALKIMANAFYGFLSYAGSRFYNYDMADSITTCTRWTLKQLKIAIEEGYEKTNPNMMKIGEPLYKNGPMYGGGGLGWVAVFSDTDSLGLKNIQNKFSIDDLNSFFFEFNDKLTEQWNVKIAKIDHYHPVTKEKFVKPHFMVFEYENTYVEGIWFKKKRYAKLTKKKDGTLKLGITGLDCLNSKTNRLAVKLQKEMLEEMLNHKFDLELWLIKLEELKIKVFNGGLEKEYLEMVKTVKNKPEHYSGATIDSKTGKPKIKKDGSIQQKAVPGHVILQKKLLERGLPIFIGSKLPYFVTTNKPKINAEWIEDYEEGMEYSKEYYWKAILSPLIRTFYAYDRNMFQIDDPKQFKNTRFGSLIGMTHNATLTLVGGTADEDEDDEGDDD